MGRFPSRVGEKWAIHSLLEIALEYKELGSLRCTLRRIATRKYLLIRGKAMLTRRIEIPFLRVPVHQDRPPRSFGNRCKRLGNLTAPLVFGLFSVGILSAPLVLAGVISAWPPRTTSSYETDLVASPLLPLVSFLNLLPTGTERGIDPADRWTVTANIEAGHIWNGHQTLQHVNQFVNDPATQDSDQDPLTPEYDRHATGVGSIIGGRSTQDQHLGIAHNTELHSGALATKWSGKAYSGSFTTTPQAVATAYGAFFGFADVINSSWGGGDPAGTSFPALITDGLANQNPNTTFVVSAGNAGPDPNTVGGPGSGYNNITVGALQNNGSDVYDTVARFSSRGPHDYSDPVNGTVPGVRADVDIVAPGTHLTTAHYGGQSGGNHPDLPGNIASGGPNAYLANTKGTSFAAPIVAAAATLVVTAAKSTLALTNNSSARDARVIKSVLLNSADKIPGWNNGQIPHSNGLGGVVTTQALDWASGAGALNLDRAHDQYVTAETRDVVGLGGGMVKKTGWDYGQVGIEKSNIYRISEILPVDTLLAVTLSWFRDRTFTPGTFMAGELGHADLDLIIRDTVTNQIIAESISTYNVVEHLYFNLPASSLYQIEVNYGGNLFGAIKREEYGLAWSTTPSAEARAAARRCRGGASARSVTPGEPHPAVCFGATHHPTRTGLGVLPRGGWLVAK
ncbi:hypothetical protein CCP3SC15_570005 [Gammaproteobacteria bacterium]